MATTGSWLMPCYTKARGVWWEIPVATTGSWAMPCYTNARCVWWGIPVATTRSWAMPCYTKARGVWWGIPVATTRSWEMPCYTKARDVWWGEFCDSYHVLCNAAPRQGMGCVMGTSVRATESRTMPHCAFDLMCRGEESVL